MRKLAAVLLSVVCVCDSAHAQRTDNVAGAVSSFLRQEIKQGNIVGAQIRLRSAKSSPRRGINFGKVGQHSLTPVSDDTLFCIASCSKPIASALIFTLLDDRKLSLNQRAGELIPAMDSISTTNGQPTESPTLRELLAHRGGIYSQKRQASPLQISAIRDFSRTLDESVAIIAAQPLISKPGSEYAYSGAGYCIVGSMAEKATGKDFESLLQEKLCDPLQMTATTFFPDQSRFDEIAEGGKSNFKPPHTLGPNLKFPLIGGSLYTNAIDLSHFVEMILGGGHFQGRTVLSKTAYSHLVSQPFPAQPYGYGWTLSMKNGRVTGLSHNGSLPPYQSAVRINLEEKSYSIAIWTLANPSNVQATIRIRDRLTQILR